MADFLSKTTFHTIRSLVIIIIIRGKGLARPEVSLSASMNLYQRGGFTNINPVRSNFEAYTQSKNVGAES